MSKKNIFAKFQDYVNKPKRNVFDLSFANNITTKFGQLTPVFCKECIPGDSFKIHSRFALQMMPMKFPVQTPMRAYLHFFYVRNRTLYKDWMDFIGGTKDNLTLPYVTPPDKKKFFRVGGLADYLGVPNVMYRGVFEEFGLSAMSDYFVYSINKNGNEPPYQIKSPSSATALYTVKSDFFPWVPKTFTETLDNSAFSTFPEVHDGDQIYHLTPANLFEETAATPTYAPWYRVVSVDTGDSTSNKFIDSFDFFVSNDLNTRETCRTFVILGRNGAVNSDSVEYCIPMFKKIVPVDVEVTDNLTRDGFHVVLSELEAQILSNYRYIDLFTYNNVNNNGYCMFSLHHSTSSSDVNNPVLKIGVLNEITGGNPFNVLGDDGMTETPYDSDIHLNALPFRAYEAIYNSYYRNAQNNPYILDGVAEYNKYIPSYDGGADSNQYDLYQRNWEYDFLTSAVQTPQQGDIAPLVGISVTGEATFQDENGNTYYASAQYDSDGNITGWTSHSPNMPQGSLRLLMDMAGTGISINDLRNVNAFQKFLENNIRRGLKYRDQIKSHFGVDVRYDELDMPEFIGGCSTDVNINKLSQTSESGNTPLGSFVGQASAYGESKYDITHYCDEHGFIIGILSIVPVPVYSQLLPKFFLKSEQLDYFFPEFGHIGYQPILQKEVSPLQTYYEGGNLNKVFGYQRSWYDYLSSTDEVHAQFRTTMRDFLMNRTFETEPELSKDFLLVDPDQLNDVFLSGTDDDIYAPESDKIIGSLYFNVSKKSPIPLFGIPRLD